MRHTKPIPKESSFKEFSDNQAKDPRRARAQSRKPTGVSSKIKKMFNDRSDARSQKSGSSSGNSYSRSNDRNGSSSSGTRTTFSGKTASSGNSYSRSNDRSGSSSSGSRGSFSRSNDSKGSFSRDSNSRSTYAGRSDSRGTDSRRSFSRQEDSSQQDSRSNNSRNTYRGRENVRGPTAGQEDRRRSDSKRPTGKHDRRDPNNRGKSFKDDRRNNGSTREMFDAICQKCGKPCQVPFKPTPGKGVSCSECFESKARNNDSQYGKKTGGFNSRDSPRKKWDDIAPSMRGAERRSRDGISHRGFTKREDNGQRFAETKSGRKELFDAVCMKCGAKCKVPFKPTGKMGVSCTNCYNKNESPFKGGKKKADAKTHGQRINDHNRAAYGKKRY